MENGAVTRKEAFERRRETVRWFVCGSKGDEDKVVEDAVAAVLWEDAAEAGVGRVQYGAWRIF
jgi:hypothetical protein